MAKLKSQGTSVYFIDPVNDNIVELDCVTAISGITASRDQIETTCLKDQARKYESGMMTPGTASFTVSYDPADAALTRLHQLYVTGETINFAIGLSDGVAEPTGVDSDGDFITPTSRSFVLFEGYVSEFPWDFALNALVTNAISVQVSDFPTVLNKV